MSSDTCGRLAAQSQALTSSSRTDSLERSLTESLTDQQSLRRTTEYSLTEISEPMIHIRIDDQISTNDNFLDNRESESFNYRGGSDTNSTTDYANSISNDQTRHSFTIMSPAFWSSVEFLFSLSQAISALLVLAISQDEKPDAPLPLWVLGYGVACLLSLPLIYYRYKHPFDIYNTTYNYTSSSLTFSADRHRYTELSSDSSSSSSSMYSNSFQQRLFFNLRRFFRKTWFSCCSFITSVFCCRMEVWMEKLRMMLDFFFAVWFVLGNVWVFGRPSLAQQSPKLYRLCVAFLALSSLSYALPFILCAMVCCCLPCLLGVGDTQSENKGATPEAIAGLPVYTFRSVSSQKTHSSSSSSPSSIYNTNSSGLDELCGHEGGIITYGEYHERLISADDAACCICLDQYEDDTQLRELPCSHHFHLECLDQWLRINASCPLCKTFLAKGLDKTVQVRDSRRGGERFLEEV